MSEKKRALGPGNVPAAALYALIVAAPLLGGSSSLETLTALVLGAIVVAALVLWSSRASGRPLPMPTFALGLVAAAAFTTLQAVALPIDWLSGLSPRAFEIRRFVLPDAAQGAISYEIGASWREVAKLLLYAGVFVLAQHRGRGRHGLRAIASSVVVAGLAVAVTGLLHRALGTDRVFGLVDTLVPMSRAYTTFSNPNHAAGFLSLAAFCGLGLALEARSAMERRVFGVGAAACLLGSLAAFSRAGMFATAVAGLLFLYAFTRRETSRGRRIPATARGGIFALTALSVALALYLRAPEIERELEGAQRGAVIGLDAKLAAMKDAIPMTLEHPWLGIGRGAYASLYTLYKTSSIQLTFAFPENIAAQFLSEWGLLFGGIALFALLFALLRRLLRADGGLTLAIMAGVAGLVIHNLLDFSLELPGVAVPVVALLGAVSSRLMPSARVASPGWSTQVAVVGVWALLMIGAVIGSFAAGEIFRDLRSVSALVSSAEGPRELSPAEPARLELLQARHPANALLSVQLAYARETSQPPELRRALSLANRAMYLAPTYAEGYFIGGRVLIKLGHRAQGLGLLRNAWALSASPNQIIEQVVWYAIDAADVRRAIPRTDEMGELLSAPAVRRAVRALRARGRREDASELLASLTMLNRYETDHLLMLAELALEQRNAPLATRFIGPLVSGEAKEPRALLLEARILEIEKRYEELLSRLEPLLDAKGVDRGEVLELRLRAETALGDFAGARRTLEALRQASPPSYANRAEHARLEAKLELAAGRPAVALSVLSAALDVVPEDDRLRLLRAQVLADQGRRPEAIRDLELVLRTRPRHAGARRALERLRAAETAGSSLE